MTRGTFEIVNELGLHARAASRLVHLASQYDATVFLEKDGFARERQERHGRFVALWDSAGAG